MRKRLLAVFVLLMLFAGTFLFAAGEPRVYAQKCRYKGKPHLDGGILTCDCTADKDTGGCECIVAGDCPPGSGGTPATEEEFAQ